jgi:tetratricopeptide (TPR) repeat protein
MTQIPEPDQHLELQAFHAARKSGQTTQMAELALALASRGALPLVDALAAGQRLLDAGLAGQATALYRLWLQHADSPAAYVALFHLGTCLEATGDEAGAEDAYRRAIALKPGFIEGHLSLATLLEHKGEAREALMLLNRVTSIADPAIEADKHFYLQALNSMGRVLELWEQFAEAEAVLSQSLRTDPEQPKVLAKVIDLRRRQCRAPVDAPIDGVSEAQMATAVADAAEVPPAAPEPQPAADPTALTNVMVIISESDIASALEVVGELDSYKTYVFDAALVDKVIRSGLREIEFIDWEDCLDYFDLDKTANEQVYAMERALTEALAPLLPEVTLLSWQHLHFYYLVKTARWYKGMWQSLVHRFSTVRPFIFVNDNPAQFYWPSFIPSLTLVETLIGRGIPFSGFTSGARADHPGFIPLLVRDDDAPLAADILTHLPTCFYDAPYFNHEIEASGKSVINIPSKYWDIPVGCATTLPLRRIDTFSDALPAELVQQIDEAVTRLEQSLDELLAPYIRTGEYRGRQARHIGALFRAQIWTYLLLGRYFAGRHPSKMLLSDHDTDFLGPLVSYARQHQIPVLILPHSKVSPDLFYSYGNATSLMHPMCGETILDAYGKRVRHISLAYPESIAHEVKYPAPLLRVGLLLNAITTSSGVYNTRYAVYVAGIRQIVEWARAKGIELLVRCKPSFTMISLLERETGIDASALRGWIDLPMSQYASQCQVCLMYDAPTSGALEFLNASIPILNPVPEELSKVEARVCNPRVVPRASIEKTLETLDAFIADQRNLFHFRAEQFQNHVRTYEGAHPLRTFI